MPLASADALALTGMMGSGKSTVARILGRWLRRRVTSTDAEIERLAGKPIPRIFAEDGERAFREMERWAVAGVNGPLVVDLGGGAFCDAVNAERLLASGCVVFLDVSAAEASRRIAAGEAGARPLAASWPALLARRLPLYRRAHHVVEVDGLAPEAVARRVLDVVCGTNGGSVRGGLNGRSVRGEPVEPRTGTPVARSPFDRLRANGGCGLRANGPLGPLGFRATDGAP